MQISIIIEIEKPEEITDEICDGVREACLCVVANMRSQGLLSVDQERYVTDKVKDPIIGQVSYFRPE